jgi:hypothetical protein
MDATEPAQLMKAGLALLCITLPLMHTFAFTRVSKMNYAELPLWYNAAPLPTLFVSIIAILFWPIFISGIIWNFVVLQWWIALITIAIAFILASMIEAKMPPMLTVLLTGLPSFFLAVIIWFV